MDKKELVEVYAESFSHAIENIEKQENFSTGKKYKEVSYHYALIIEILTDKDGSLSLKELLPITKVYADYKEQYLGQ